MHLRHNQGACQKLKNQDYAKKNTENNFASITKNTHGNGTRR